MPSISPSASKHFYWKIGETLDYSSGVYAFVSAVSNAIIGLLKRFRYWALALLAVHWLICLTESGSVALASRNFCMSILHLAFPLLLGCAFLVVVALLSVLRIRIGQDHVSISEQRILAKQNDKWHEVPWDDVECCELVEKPFGNTTLKITLIHDAVEGQIDPIPVPNHVQIEQLSTLLVSKVPHATIRVEREGK